VKLTTVAFFGLGYVLGSRAGRERYEQLVEATKGAAKRFEERRPTADRPKTYASSNGSQFDWSEPLPRS